MHECVYCSNICIVCVYCSNVCVVCVVGMHECLLLPWLLGVIGGRFIPCSSADAELWSA